MIRYSGGTIVDRTYVSDGSRGQMIAEITSALVEAGWTAWGSSVYESATTPQGFKIRTDVIDGGTAVNLRIQTDSLINLGNLNGAFQLPVVGRTFRIWANKYQCFHFASGSANITQPCDVAFGVLWTPPFMPVPSNEPIFDQDLIAFSETSTEDCMQRVYHAWTFGPWAQDTQVRIWGHVDDDIRVNGEIWDEGLFPFTSGRGVPCDGIANGEHDFDRTFDLPADTELFIELVNNFISTASMNAHITVVSAPHTARALGPSQYTSIGWGGGGGPGPGAPPVDPADQDPWYGWQASNGATLAGDQNVFGFRGHFEQLSAAFGSDWIWDGVAYHDTGGTCRMISQVCWQGVPSTSESSGYWENGVVSLYEPYVGWASGHTVSGNWSQTVRKGQMWDALVYAAPIPSEVIKVIDGKNWRNVTIPTSLGGYQVPHSLMLLTN